MARRALFTLILSAMLLTALGACHRGSGERQAPPDARRPAIKPEAELAAERDERIRTGAVVPTSAPALGETANATSPKVAIPPPIQPTPGAIEAEILLVNDAALTLPEVLYPVRKRLLELRQTQTREGFVEAAQRLLRARVQQEIGAMLIYKEAMGKLGEPQKKFVSEAVEREVQHRISREFGGSSARFQHHLALHGLALEGYRAQLERDLVARQYTREKLLPQVSVRRDELLGQYRRDPNKYATPETRALFMIEAPFAAFLPAGATWPQAPANTRAQAKLRAARHIREAHLALRDKPFEEVARDYSRGVHSAQGGAWGEIGRPLQPPYNQVSRRVFELAAGEYSEPIETDTGWYIVRCGLITPARPVPFTDVQDELREQLTERKFEKLSAEYLIRLAGGATVSSMDAFIRAGVRRAIELSSDDEAER